jgi:uncharacterized phage protein (TIGR01671 family)
MNREIEFRGFDGTEWYYGDLEYNRKTDVARIHTYKEDGSYSRQYAVDPDTVGQFTGMTDKHGKKVFEDDIVRRRDSAFGYVDTGVVKYDCHLGAFILEYKSYGRTYQSTFKKGFSYNDGKCTIEGTYSYEVIGNVYDNKDLLTEK